jgi:hypothetical protein
MLEEDNNKQIPCEITIASEAMSKASQKKQDHSSRNMVLITCSSGHESDKLYQSKVRREKQFVELL